MTRGQQNPTARPINGLGGMLALSLAFHLVFLFGATQLDFFRNELRVDPRTIYVDVVNLPVAAPRAGAPSGSGTGNQPASEMTPPPALRAMTLPEVKPAPVKSVKVPSKAETGETSHEYQARLDAMEQEAEARRQEAALATIRNRIATRNSGSPPAGMPGGTGNQAGSDYAAYLQSRLKESFAVTIDWKSKKPLVAVRLTVDAKGALVSYKIEKSTGDEIFEDSVERAVQMAKKHFPPPPYGKEFTYGFVFKPEGVDKK